MKGSKTKRILGLLFAIIFILGGIGALGANKAEAVTGSASASNKQTSESKDDKSKNIKSKDDNSKNDKSKNKGMNVHFIDVGQADCILVESAGKFMLVDAGNNDDADTIIDYLNDQGVKKLDYVIGTHPHEDHIGSLDTVINTYEIDTLIMPAKAHTTKTFEDVVAAIEKKKLSITDPVPGKKYKLGDSEFTILSPEKGKDYGDNYNNWSVGIKLENGKNRFVLCGDAEKDSEKDMLDSGIDLKADVLKLSHHGSRTSTTDAFLKAVKPEYAVISVGKDNDYGLPDEESLEKLTENKIKYFRTDELGTIVASSDGSSIKWKYTTGKDSKNGKSGEVKSSQSEKRTSESATEALAKGMDYIININTGKFHKPGCSSVNQMNDSNKQHYNGSRDDLIGKGYDPCKRCNP